MNKMKSLSLLFLLFIFSCATKFKNPEKFINSPNECSALEDGLSGISSEPDYGYTPDKPVRVGGGSNNELKYLHMLAGPKKEFIDEFFQAGSTWGKGVTVVGYKVVMNRDTLEKTIYLDTHNCRDPLAPLGFTVRDDFKEVK